MMINALRYLGLSFALLLSACGAEEKARIGDPEAATSCSDGESVSCSCANGQPGAAPCKGGVVGACACGAAAGGGATGASGGASASGGSSTGAGGESASGGAAPGGSIERAIIKGPEELVSLYVVSEGILMVQKRAIVLIDRSGKELRRADVTRDLMTASFDGATLVVTDGARLSVRDLTLDEKVGADLLEGCGDGVLLSGGRFVCGGTNDWDRIFYSYSTSSGEMTATSKKYTYNGIPMYRVPGRDDFVTLSGGSPTDLHLYTLGSAGEASYVNESPYHGDFGINQVLAFVGDPATHVVTFQGLLLSIYAEGCKPDVSVFDSGCFVKDGALGTLTGDGAFAGLDQDANGKLYAFVDVEGVGYNQVCRQGCLAQRIDVAGRKVEAQRSYQLDLGSVVATRHDSAANRLVVGYHERRTDDSHKGYGVLSLPYE